MTNNHLTIIVTLLVISIGLTVIIVMAFLLFVKSDYKRDYNQLRNKYRTNCVGVFKLYSGLPLPSNAMCEVAFCSNTLHIVHGHYWRAIPVEDINNIYVDTVKEGYTETLVYGNGLVGGLGMIGSAIGNASKRSAAKKNLLVIRCKSGTIAFHKFSYYSFNQLSPKERLQISGVRSKEFCLADWIILQFSDEKRKLYQYRSYQERGYRV